MAKRVQIDWLFLVMYRCTCMNTRTYGLRSPVWFSWGLFSAWRVQSIPRPAQSSVVHGNCRVASGVLGTSQRSGLWTHPTSWQLKEIRTFLLGEGELGLVTPCLGRYWLFLCLCLPEPCWGTRSVWHKNFESCKKGGRAHVRFGGCHACDGRVRVGCPQAAGLEICDLPVCYAAGHGCAELTADGSTRLSSYSR